jgi:bifunctional non-homologous end joining protein LigD
VSVVEISSPDRIMFPERGLTKADLVGYYRRVAEAMLPMMEGRPLTLHRFPRGVGAKGFMQKNVADHFPESIQRYEVPKQEGGTTVYPIVTEPEHIPWLANQGTITFHIWSSRLPDIEHPDWLILDLDPVATGTDDDGGAVALVQDVAQVTRRILDRFGLASVPVATGSKGFHLWVALDRTEPYDRVALANRALAGLVAAAEPTLATTEFLKKDRKGRVFVDWLRARRGATVVAPLSVRAKATASLAVPVDWDEVDGIRPDQWTISDADEVIERPMPSSVLTPRSLPVADIVAAARDAGVDLDIPFDRFGRSR